LFVACDDAPAFETGDVDAGSESARSTSDVLVVVFETRQAGAGVGATQWLVESGRLVLARGSDVGAWATGPARLVQRGDPKGDGLFVAHKDLLRSSLPAALTAIVGTEVKVFDDTREVCVARVATSDRFSLDAKLVHLPDSWNEDETPVAPNHEAADVFERGLPLLSAELVPLMGDCGRGIWATPVTAPRPTLFREEVLAPKLTRKAIAAFRALPAWHDAQSAMQNFWVDSPMPGYLKGKRWDTLDSAKPEATLYRSHDGTRELVVVHSNSAQGCGSEGQEVTTLFELVTAGKDTRFVEIASLPWQSAPGGIVDLEGDGMLELYTGSAPGKVPTALRLERWHPEAPAASQDNGWEDKRHEAVHELRIPDLTSWGCGC